MCLYSNNHDAYLFLEISENKKNRVPDTFCISSDCANAIKFMKAKSNFTHCKKRKNTKH